MSANKVNIAPASQETLKKLDWIIVIDHSGSTGAPSKRIEGTLYDEMREAAISAAECAGRYDDDGITLIHFSSNAVVRDGVKPQAVRDVFAEYKPGGNTMLGVALDEALKKARSSSKEVVVLVYTDGESSDPSRVIDVLNHAGKELGRPRIGFSFIQVGNDPDAQRFLDRLDNEMKVDVCATFSAEDADGLSVEQLVNAARTE
jgi:Mg-chelatase subunit ChlD